MRFENFPESVHLFNWIPSISWRLCSAAATNGLGTNTYGLAIRSQNRNAYHTSDTSDGLPKEIYVCRTWKNTSSELCELYHSEPARPSRAPLIACYLFPESSSHCFVIFSQNHLLLALLLLVSPSRAPLQRHGWIHAAGGERSPHRTEVFVPDLL